MKLILFSLSLVLIFLPGAASAAALNGHWELKSESHRCAGDGPGRYLFPVDGVKYTFDIFNRNLSLTLNFGDGAYVNVAEYRLDKLPLNNDEIVIFQDFVNLEGKSIFKATPPDNQQHSSTFFIVKGDKALKVFVTEIKSCESKIGEFTMHKIVRD